MIYVNGGEANVGDLVVTQFRAPSVDFPRGTVGMVVGFDRTHRELQVRALLSQEHTKNGQGQVCFLPLGHVLRLDVAPGLTGIMVEITKMLPIREG